MKFEMIEKGWEYRTEGYTIKKTWRRVNVTNIGFSTLDRYANKSFWNVYPDNEPHCMYSFSKLNKAKQFIINREEMNVGCI